MLYTQALRVRVDGCWALQCAWAESLYYVSRCILSLGVLMYICAATRHRFLVVVTRLNAEVRLPWQAARSRAL